MNETGKGHGLTSSIVTLASLALFAGALVVLEARQTAHDNDPAVIELEAKQAERLEAEFKGEERKTTILHYLTLAILLATAAAWVIVLLGSIAAGDNAIRRGQPAPPMPDMTLPGSIPVL